MKIFMTGATGFIGKHIAERLLKDGHSITALLLPEESETLLAGIDVSIVRGDITLPGTLKGVMDGSNGILHLAGAVGYGQTMENCLKINRDGTRNVAAEAGASGIRRFIHFSSVSVYGRVPDVSISESFPMKKIGDPYGDTKIDAEMILTGLSEKGELDLTMVRPTVIYGPGDRLFLPKIIENIKSGRARIVGKGNNTVDLIHVADVADFIAQILSDDGSKGQVYNLTNPENPTWKEFLAMIASALDMPAPERHLPYRLALIMAGVLEFISFVRKTEPPFTRYSVRVIGRQYHYMTDKYQSELGYTPRIDLRQGVTDVLAGMKRDA